MDGQVQSSAGLQAPPGASHRWSGEVGGLEALDVITHQSSLLAKALQNTSPPPMGSFISPKRRRREGGKGGALCTFLKNCPGN